LVLFINSIIEKSAQLLTAYSYDKVCTLKGHSTSVKMNVYLKWVIYVEEM